MAMCKCGHTERIHNAGCCLAMNPDGSLCYCKNFRPVATGREVPA